VKVAAIQHDIAWEAPEENFARLAPRIGEAAAAGAALVLLSEMYATGFSMATERVGEAIDGPSTRFLVEQASAHRVWVGGTLPERSAAEDRPANVFVLAGPDGAVHRYAKIHPFTYGREHEHYAAGTTTCTVPVDDLRASLFVCYDLRFADSFWAVAPGTDVYLVPANWPAARRRHWQALLVARAIENQAYVVGVNRVGADGNGLDYAGDTVVIDPLGEIVAAAPEGEEAVVLADLDPAEVRRVRARFPFLADRRPHP